MFALLAQFLLQLLVSKLILVSYIFIFWIAIVGDITPSDGVPKEEKSRREQEALDHMCKLLGGGPRGIHSALFYFIKVTSLLCVNCHTVINFTRVNNIFCTYCNWLQPRRYMTSGESMKKLQAKKPRLLRTLTRYSMIW